MFTSFSLGFLLQYALIGILDYYLIQFLYYWFHRFIHLPIAGIFYRAHYIGHHKRDFPIRKLRATTYNIDGSSGWFKTGGEIVFLLPIIGISILAYLLVSNPNFIIFETVLLGNVIVGEFLHSSYHLTDDAINHPESVTLHRKIYNYGLFARLQYLHDLHHMYRYGNFGFFDMTMDKIFGTFQVTKPSYLQKNIKLI